MSKLTLPSARRVVAACAAALALIVAAPATAQVTTGSLAGSVTAESDGSALPGVAIAAVHVPTGTNYSAITGADGRFLIANVRVGGPYSVTATLDGFRPTQTTGVSVNLGAITEVDVALPLAEVAETIEVVGNFDEFLNPNRTGSASAVSLQQLESLPSVRRSLQDFARTNPYFNVDPSDPSSTRISVGGRNNRYNSIQIDGAVNNDLFGLADTGTPGGQTDTQPISLDAVEQLQLVVSPYDIRQGGFTGGGLNAVTRSGSNEFHGSVYGSVRDQDYVGDGPFDRPIAEFDEDQYGARIGGPLMRDKMFFFLSGEINTRKQPTGVSADGSTGTVYRDPAGAASFRDTLSGTYGYDPGGLGDISGATDSDLIFGRLDWNVADAHQLTLRHNYVDAVRDTIADRSGIRFRFPTAIYTIADETNSTVAQLNSVFGSSFNEARIGLQTIKDVRDVPVIFPSVEVGGRPRSADLIAGTERFSGANALDQDILELTDDFTFVKGSHTITVGTHNEFFEFKNLFLSDFYGYYFFPDLAAFEAGVASEYSIGFANGSDPRRPASFEANQYGIYAGDQWRVSDTLSMTFGLRADMARFPDAPSFNAAIQDAIGFSTAETPSEDPVFSPRLGFNWDPTGEGDQQLRGGLGIFAGRTPYVWISNAYANTGVESTALSFRGAIPFNPDPLNQPRDLGAAGTVTVDLIDPDFEFPRLLRATLGYDRELFWGVRGSAELVWSQTQKDVFYQNVNKTEVGTSPLDGRPTYTSRSSAVRDGLLLTNTDEGEETLFSILLNRPFTNGLTLTANYAWMDAESAFDATSSRAISNWQFMPTDGDIFRAKSATSMFEIEHRFSLSGSYAFQTGPVGHTVALYWNAQSGRPYTLLLGGDPNTDGYSTNDLLYVPGSADEIILKDSSGAVIPYDRLADYLSHAGIDATAGRILDRNESVEPWSHLLDFHYDVELPIKVLSTQLTFDVLNVLNLIDSDKGVVRFVNFQTTTPVNYRGIDAETGKPIYQEAFSGALNGGSQFTTSDLRSRWQMKLGLRLSF
jgi:hypothetical protein